MFSLRPFRANSTWNGQQRSREDNLMDRRSFILSLIGGAAAASVGAVAMAQAAPVPLAPEPVDAKPAEPHAARSLDDTDAAFSRHRYRHHRRHHRRHYRRHRRYYRR
jgi:arylamine N-acetyltransferase